MAKQGAWEIAVIDANSKRWPSATKLVEVGVPLRIARRYARVRRDMTAGLRRRVRQAVN